MRDFCHFTFYTFDAVATLPTKVLNYHTMGSICSQPRVMTEYYEKKQMLATCQRYEEMARKEISENGILTDERYKEALNLLNPSEQKALKACFGNFKIEVHKLQGVLTDWLFNQKNWTVTDSGNTTVRFSMNTVGSADVRPGFIGGAVGPASHAHVLQLFRKIRSTEAIAVMEMVDTLVARLYSEIEGTPGPITNTTKYKEQTEGQKRYRIA